ncbi:MAG: hypothetical protein HY608_10720 [Planctomycetes bacterium]|nr:hypothetical protein [Planctomycetota bacterium]
MDGVEKTPPVLQAFVLADHVYTDAHTGKKVIAGTFNQLWADKYPTQFATATYAYLALRELYGEAQVSLKFIGLADQRVHLQSQPMKVGASDPRATAELVITIPPFPMPEPGDYALEAYADGVLLGMVRMRLGVRGEGKDPRPPTV